MVMDAIRSIAGDGEGGADRADHGDDHPPKDVAAEDVVGWLVQEGDHDVAEIVAALVEAVAEEHSRVDHRPLYPVGAPRANERVIDAEREALEDRILAVVEERLAELDEERQASERAGLWAFEADLTGVLGHPAEENLRKAFQAVYEQLEAAGPDDGLTDAELQAAFDRAFTGRPSAREPTRFWQRWAPLLADAPDVDVVEAGVWSLAGEPVDDDALQAAIDEAPASCQDLPLATIYDLIADREELVTTARLVAALDAHTDGDRETFAEASVGTTGPPAPECIGALPGVEPPEDGAPALRYAPAGAAPRGGDGDGEGGADE